MKRRRMIAVVHCAGGCLTSEDGRACVYGCLMCGACVEKCRRHAIALQEDRQAACVDRSKCVGCGLCAKACPQGIIGMEPAENAIHPLCSNRDPGRAARAECPNSCIACSICAKNCPADAIHIEENAPVIDADLCISCGMCAVRCPRGVIHDVWGILAPPMSYGEEAANG